MCVSMPMLCALPGIAARIRMNKPRMELLCHISRLAQRQRKSENNQMMSSAELALTRQPNLEAALAHFRALMQKDDSPIRAIRHQPARAAEYLDIPDAVDPKLRAALIRRNMPKLYTHQAAAFDLAK